MQRAGADPAGAGAMSGRPLRRPARVDVIEEGYDPAYFVALTGEAAERWPATNCRRLELGKRRGFGSVKVDARIGGSTWPTSLFPRKNKARAVPAGQEAVRRAEGLIEGDAVEVELSCSTYSLRLRHRVAGAQRADDAGEVREVLHLEIDLIGVERDRRAGSARG